MKNRIKKWLEIETPKHISATDLRKMVGEAVVDALNGKSDERWSFWGFPCNFGNTLTSALKQASHETASEVAAECCQKAISQRVDGEAFIDEIIARIRRKQLDA